jgi:hypothetical protein
VGLLDGAVIAGLVACIVALAFYPGLILHRTEQSTSTALTAVCGVHGFSGTYIGRLPPVSEFPGGCQTPQQLRDYARASGALNVRVIK